MFNRNSAFAIAAISILATVALAPTGASAMRVSYDGGWAVQITTTHGTCSSGVGFSVEVRNGVVQAVGGVDVHGNVAPNGATRVSITAGNQTANGSGRLSGNSGGGTWKGVGSEGVCSGSWSATRR